MRQLDSLGCLLEGALQSTWILSRLSGAIFYFVCSLVFDDYVCGRRWKTEEQVFKCELRSNCPFSVH